MRLTDKGGHVKGVPFSEIEVTRTGGLHSQRGVRVFILKMEDRKEGKYSNAWKESVEARPKTTSRT